MILCRVDYFGYCDLDVISGECRKYPKGCRPSGNYVCEGLYYEYNNIFFAIYATPNGPMFYYKERVYPLMPGLSISVEKKGNNRHFSVKEYGIEIDYPTSEFIDMDIWSAEEDVDLFVNIANNYRNEAFYAIYTSDSGRANLY